MTNALALQAILFTNPEVLGIAHEAGAREASLRADIIAVRGNPLTDLTALQEVDLVIKGGDVTKNSI